MNTKRGTMPGGRLTRQERRRIAAGLGEGLGYAEIARRLGRPPSTVSREVARNGGPHGYSADAAHRATARRARRRRPVPPLERAVDTGGRDPRAVRAFEEWFATMLAQTGLPMMAARVLTCLFAADSGSLTAAGLAQRLRVSPASVSKAVGYLEEQGLMRRERVEGRRRERYVIDDDIWHWALLASARRNAILADAAGRGAGVLGTGTPAGVRLMAGALFLREISADIVRTAEQRLRSRPVMGEGGLPR